MKEDIITIDENGTVTFPANGIVWMAEYEIAGLFDVFYSAVSSNIRAIFKSSVLRKEDVCKEVEVPKGYLELYNLEMITALAFRIKSRNTQIFRNWLMKKVFTSPVVIKLKQIDYPTDNYLLN